MLIQLLLLLMQLSASDDEEKKIFQASLERFLSFSQNSVKVSQGERGSNLVRSVSLSSFICCKCERFLIVYRKQTASWISIKYFFKNSIWQYISLQWCFLEKLFSKFSAVKYLWRRMYWVERQSVSEWVISCPVTVKRRAAMHPLNTAVTAVQ